MIHKNKAKNAGNLWRSYTAAVQSGNLARGLKIARAGVAEQKKKRQGVHAAIWQRKVANVLFQQGKPRDSIREASVALRMTSDPYERALTLIFIGAIYSFVRRFDRATVFFDRAYAIAGDFRGDIYLWTHFYGARALALKRQGRIDQALVDYEGAAGMLVETGQLWRAAAYINNIAFLLIQEQSLREAEQRLRQAVSLIRRDKHAHTEAAICDTFGHLYTLLGNRKRALRFLNRAKSLFEKLDNKTELIATLIHLSSYFISVNDWPKARAEAARAYWTASLLKKPDLLQEARAQRDRVAEARKAQSGKKPNRYAITER